MGRAIIYSYDDRELPDDLEVETKNQLSLKKGDIITRHNRTWKIESLHHEPLNEESSVWMRLVQPPIN